MSSKHLPNNNIFSRFHSFTRNLFRYKKGGAIVLLGNIIGVIIVAFLPYILMPYQAVAIPEFNFAAVGDWGCNSKTKNTVNNIENNEPEIILGLGDYSYERKADCWLDVVEPINDKMRISIGNHDMGSLNSTGLSRLEHYQEHFELSSHFYSFNYQNVHFVSMSTEPPTNSSIAQYNFVKDDLAAASSNKSIGWIVVFFHKPLYTSPSTHEAEYELRNHYHPLFDQYGVDLVLQAHNHIYERSYPIKYNSDSPSEPIITNKSKEVYDATKLGDLKAPIFATVGTGGKSIHDLDGKAPYIEDQYEGYGYLDIRITEDGRTLKGRFYANDGTTQDRFTIIKR